MGITERKEREKVERKALIMRCAKELILELGVEKVSMMDIARKAELSKATIYLYFSSKEMLFEEICLEAGNDFIDYIRKRMTPGISALETMKLLWVSYLEIFGEAEDMMILMFNNIRNYLESAFSPGGEKANAPSYIFCALIKDILKQGIAEGVFEPSINPEMVSRTIIALFSYVIESAARIPGEDRKSHVTTSEMKNIFEIMLRGIAREGLDRSRLVLPGSITPNHREYN
ncbi:MAG: TetR/AcrR family transcriptional regulator [Treponema sp.]|jgi:AcrR family transcriptional regulator|nr:TetR/AcrR family transcriptional regulator [Treponema sp.]